MHRDVHRVPVALHVRAWLFWYLYVVALQWHRVGLAGLDYPAQRLAEVGGAEDAWFGRVVGEYLEYGPPDDFFARFAGQGAYERRSHPMIMKSVRQDQHRSREIPKYRHVIDSDQHSSLRPLSSRSAFEPPKELFTFRGDADRPHTGCLPGRDSALGQASEPGRCFLLLAGLDSGAEQPVRCRRQPPPANRPWWLAVPWPVVASRPAPRAVRCNWRQAAARPVASPNPPILPHAPRRAAQVPARRITSSGNPPIPRPDRVTLDPPGPARTVFGRPSSGSAHFLPLCPELDGKMTA